MQAVETQNVSHLQPVSFYGRPTPRTDHLGDLRLAGHPFAQFLSFVLMHNSHSVLAAQLVRHVSSPSLRPTRVVAGYTGLFPTAERMFVRSDAAKLPAEAKRGLNRTSAQGGGDAEFVAGLRDQGIISHHLLGNLLGEYGIEPTSAVDRRQRRPEAYAAAPQLQCDSDRQSRARIPAIVKVVPVVKTDIKVIGLTPVC